MQAAAAAAAAAAARPVRPHLRHVAVAVAQPVGRQLHRAPVPAVVGGGLAQHDLGAGGEDGGNALGACGGSAGGGGRWRGPSAISLRPPLHAEALPTQGQRAPHHTALQCTE